MPKKSSKFYEIPKVKEVSIIIVTWNSEEYIENCLIALSRGGVTPPVQIILVDNASQDRTVELVKRKFPDVRIIENPSNLGLSKAINQGAKLSSGEYILLLNPDVVVMESAIQKLFQFMAKRKDVGACGPRFFSPSGKIQPSCREFPTFKNLFTEFTGLGRLLKCSSWKMWYFNYNGPMEVDQPMGSCLLIRRKVFNEIGGMNERYPIFMNDVDLCYWIKQLGYKIYFVPSANVIHYIGGSTRKVRRKMILEEHWSMYRYLKDHYGVARLVSRKAGVPMKSGLLLYAFLLLMTAFYRILFSFFTRK